MDDTKNDEPTNVFVTAMKPLGLVFGGDKIYNGVNNLFYALNYPGRLFAKQTDYGNIWYGLAFVAVVGLVLAGAALYLGYGAESHFINIPTRASFFYPRF